MKPQISFKEWWFAKNPGLIKQIEAACKKPYEEITIKELEDFIEDLKKTK